MNAVTADRLRRTNRRLRIAVSALAVLTLWLLVREGQRWGAWGIDNLPGPINVLVFAVLIVVVLAVLALPTTALIVATAALVRLMGRWRRERLERERGDR